MSELTQAKLKSLLSYDAETGIFVRLKSFPNALKGDVAGSRDKDGYLTIKLLGKSYKAHRLAWLYVHGVWPKGQMDHIFHIKDDNRIVKIRDASHVINGRNRPLNKNNTTGFNGVSFIKREGVFRASIRVNGKPIILGRFKDIEDAIASRKDANIKYGFHENHGRSFA